MGQLEGKTSVVTTTSARSPRRSTCPPATVALAVAAVLAAIDRALRLKSTWMAD